MTAFNRFAAIRGHFGVFLLGAAMIRVAFADPLSASWAVANADAEAWAVVEADAVVPPSPVFVILLSGVFFVAAATEWGQ